MPERPSITETVSWLRDRDYYAGQIVDHRTLPGQSASKSSLDMLPVVNAALNRRGIDQLYDHQVRAIEAVRSGENTVIATPTASGKSLTYLIPALERAVEQNEKTLYIAPYRALINDQAKTFQEYADDLGFDIDVGVGVQTGRTDKSERKKLKREKQPDIVLTTIDQIHLSVAPYGNSSQNWKWLFHQLGTVVIDEVHMNRGHFGSHTSLVFRRLNRLCERLNADPSYICCSATIGNPVEHAATVTDQPPESFTLIDEDASLSGDEHWLLWNPPLKSDDEPGRERSIENEPEGPQGVDEEAPDRNNAEAPATPDTNNRRPKPRAIPHRDSVQGGERRSHHQESIHLFTDLVQRGYQTLVFTRSRQGAAQYAEQSDRLLRGRNHEELAESVHAYHGALDNGPRVELEEALRNGDARGVWSTEAMELGVDIGTLDVVILDGYPGTRMSTFQRAGRAGRGDDDSLVILVGGDDPLDQYVMRDPDQLFDGGVESAMVNPKNEAILPDHVVCAADDWWLEPDDKAHFGEAFPSIVRRLKEEGRLQPVDERDPILWDTDEDSPQMNTDIRGIRGQQITLRDRLSNDRLGELQYQSAMRDAHPGALYTHQKRTYEVVDFDLAAGEARLESNQTQAYTEAITDKEVIVEETIERGTLDWNGIDVQKTLATVTVTERVESYLYHNSPQDDSPVERSIDDPLPPSEYMTTGITLEFPEPLQTAVRKRATDSEGWGNALHAVEHAMISLFPREVLCDRADIGGLSIERHSQTTGGTVFIHDGFEGGAGYCRAAFESLHSLLEETQALVTQCNCASGCPSCIHSPHCGNANRYLDKQLGEVLLTASPEEVET
ncbi:DEAD/DEAH box helicase [Natronoarchaeum rubrum]|uniref:DEAD/DEAH box helicase n=1 Tax=Natronoarchaeum rubrum TaxID=755311 RepID=UPI002112F2B5|nr:DEAD/DEAH box helicase [Natronoarchaeum rubrum]